MTTAALDDDLTGQILKGRYRVTRLLDASGGMADVYVGVDVNVGRQVVIKLPKMNRLEQGVRDRFLEEVRLLVGMGELLTKNIVPVYDAEVSGPRPFLVMPFMPGGNLIRWSQNHPAIGENPELHFEQWMLAIATALDALHGQKLVHRDVKAANILFDAQGSAVLADFGIVKAQASSQHYRGHDMTCFGTAPGTPGYIAPEMYRLAEPTGRLDQYALAVTTYVLVTPRRVLPVPVEGDASKFLRPIKPPHEHDPRVPPAVSAVVLRGLAVEPEARFATCEEFVREFRDAWAPRRRPRRRRANGPAPAVDAPGWRMLLLGLLRSFARPAGPYDGPPVRQDYRIRRLSVDTAKTMAAHTTSLRLHAVTRVSTDVARILAAHGGGVLSLGGLQDLDADLAAALADHVGQLLLDGLTTLDREAARALARHRGGISLNGLASVDRETAALLATQRGRLALGGLARLDPQVAEALTPHGHELQLDGLRDLDALLAGILARHAGPLSLAGLESLSAAAATCLSRHEHTLWLCGLRRLDDEAALALARHPGLLFVPRLRDLGPRGRAGLEANPAVRF